MGSDWPLVVHDSTPAGAVRSLTARLRHTEGRIQIRYLLEGDLERIRIPAEAVAERADGLWKHTCFEAFIGTSGASAYYELNAAPSRRWALYRFDAYRKGRVSPEIRAAPEVAIGRFATGLEVIVTIDALELELDAAERRAVRIGLSAVIEAGDGALSYWALAHPPGRPDFHARRGFARELVLCGG